MFPRTQLFRPSTSEASEEATKSPDTHWTSNLSSGGMTRIAQSVVRSTCDEDPGAGFLYESCWK